MSPLAGNNSENLEFTMRHQQYLQGDTIYILPTSVAAELFFVDHLGPDRSISDPIRVRSISDPMNILSGIEFIEKTKPTVFF